MNDLEAEYKLENRTGLPEHLRVLVQKHPRPTWEGHGNFSDLTKFWLERHIMFRDLLKRLQGESESFLDNKIDGRTYGSQTQHLAGFFLNQLHTHHHMEDDHYFPLLSAQDERLVKGFELLDSDHHNLNAKIHGMADTTNAMLQALQSGDAKPKAEDLRKHLVGFETFLNRHLNDEEELVVPVILEYAPKDLF